MNRGNRLFAVLGVLFALVGSAPVLARQDEGSVATVEPGLPLDARLGGTQESFEAKYGKPVMPTSKKEIYPEYPIPGYSAVIVDFYEGRADSISLFAPRPKGEEWTHDKPNKMNWSVIKAHQIAKRFLPSDVTFPNGVKLERSDNSIFGYISTVGFSQALANDVPEDVYAYVDNTYTVGQCSYSLVFDKDNTGVSWISIDLQVEE